MFMHNSKISLIFLAERTHNFNIKSFLKKRKNCSVAKSDPMSLQSTQKKISQNLEG